MYALEFSAFVNDECPCGRGEEEVRENRPNDAGKRIWRCTECIDQEPSCGLCLRDRHRNSPFHQVQRWNGKFFERSSLGAVNLAIHLGHPGGRCPGTTNDEMGTVMTVADVTGIHTMRMFSCKCRGHGEDAEPVIEQLLRARFWPATFTNPRSIYTFRLMDHWHLDVMQGKKPVYDYWLSLQRRTKVVAKDLVSTSCDSQHFLTSMYRRAIATSDARGVITATQHRGSKVVKGRVSTSSCRPIGIRDQSPLSAPRARNLTSIFRRTGRAESRTPSKGAQHMRASTSSKLPRRSKFVKILAIDACFKAHLKNKRHDPNDRSLNMGGAYFAHYEEFLAYEEKFKTKTEVRLSKTDTFGLH